MLPPFYQRYVDLVPEKDLVEGLDKQGRSTSSLLRSIAEDKASFRYAPGKWSVKGVVGHFTDTERVFTYRAMAFARGEQKPLPGFDENAYADAAQFDRLAMRDLADTYEAIRRATVLLFHSLPEAAWQRTGVASEIPLSVRDIAFITLGHERHHLNVLRTKYGV